MKYTVTFGKDCMAEIEVINNIPTVNNAMNGWGNPIHKSEISVTPLFEDKEWYLINGVPCQYEAERNLLFWEDEDGHKFFSANAVSGQEIAHIIAKDIDAILKGIRKKIPFIVSQAAVEDSKRTVISQEEK